MLPKGKDADELAKDLATVEVDNIGKYLVRSFQTFRNPEYVPDEKIMDGAVGYLVNNLVKSRTFITDNTTQTPCKRRISVTWG